MINKDNFKDVLEHLGFTEKDNVYSKTVNGHLMQVDFDNEKLEYPTGVKYGRDTTINFSKNENFVVFECVYQLLNTGYEPKHLKLEPDTPGGRNDKPTYGDILVSDNQKHNYLLIECKTTESKGGEFAKEWQKMQKDGGQLFNYYNTFRGCQFLCLYTSDYIDGKVEQTYHLISMRDNEKYLEDNPDLKSYQQVKNDDGGKEEYFRVWKETYGGDYFENNLFESEIFNIGRRPISVVDLKKVDEETIQKKYHQFATILRQYSVSGRENAFDKLVNIFLCKVVDEANNSEHLQVYWRGAASDDYFSLQDRLQKLYTTGMDEFLGEKVTYIGDEDIDKAFYLFKNKKDETKKTIRDYFKQLKFYSNNPFAFIDVHNRNLFFQNAEILKEVIQMLQDIKLSDEEDQNQFLGDLFEGFLDQGVKQSEGQFFTPMPIVKFLISSLPLREILDNQDIPKVIDYACGAGHFLTEYAGQVKKNLASADKDLLEKHYSNIYGIEKEYRLSKVAKVSAFMYGQKQINIIYADALAQNDKIDNASFDILIANPPYSVKGFLEILSNKDKESYSLYSSVPSDSSFNTIETFFIERAKNLLKDNGIAAIILPSSILTKTNGGNIYVKTRELLLKYFDLVAIAEFGSGTFSKTGTNTVTLFLRRKKRKPDIAEHFKNRVNQWFSGQLSDKLAEVFDDVDLLRAYCQHCGFDSEEYIKFLKHEETNLLSNSVFEEYRREFDKTTEIKNLKKRKSFQKLEIEEKENELDKRFINWMKEIEKEKVYYYLLANNVSQPVLVLKSPVGSKASETNKLMKQFLGYEWSTARGNEGIKYIGGAERTEEDGAVLSVLKGIEKIKTPLFNPKDLSDETKLNTVVRKHFSREQVQLNEEQMRYLNFYHLKDMLDFEGINLNKVIRTSVQKKVEIQTKYPLEKLSKIVSTIETGNRPKGGVGNFNEGAYSLGGEHISKDTGRLDLSVVKYVPIDYFKKATKGKLLQNDILICKDGALTGKIAILRNELDGINAMVNEHIFILRCNDSITQYYVFNFLYSEMGQRLLKENITGSAQGGLNQTNLKNIKIPLPPKDIQQQIVEECEEIDRLFEENQQKVEELREEIENTIDSITSKSELLKKICLTNPSKTEIKDIDDNLYVSFIEMASVSDKGFIEHSVDRPLKELRKGSYKYFKENDVIVAKITPCMENGKCGLAIGLTNGIGMGSSEFHVFRAHADKVLPAFLFYSLNRDKIRKEASKNMTGSSGHRRVPISFYENLYISLPSKDEQQVIVSQIQAIEQEITDLEQQMSECTAKKKDILNRYLN